MNCEQMTQLLDAYCDDELDIATVALVNTHLSSCAQCEAEYGRIQSVRSLDFRGLAASCPPQLAAQVRSSVAPAMFAPAVATPAVFTPAVFTSAVHRPRRNWLPLAVAAMILIACALVVPILLSHRQSAPLLAMDIVSAHLRSLQADHLMDVVSTDQHTVKPWFDGKLDFAPPVKDLAGQGFPLAGGRLDYLEGHPAAALIYHRNKHVINVFVWPAQGTTAQTTALIQGYNVISWSAQGMQCIAVSDLNPQEMAQFADLMQAKSPPPDR
jgi:anti-sigma factor RsiW